MEEKSSKEITLDQALEAEQYVKSYIKFKGGDPYEDAPYEHPELWPEDVQKAWETYSTFWADMKEKGMMP